jgi:hypothetical protein
LDDLWTLAIAAIMAIAFVLSLAGGWRLYQTLNRGRPDDGASTGAGYLVGASLGLLSLLIGFSLALSLDRYEARRRLVGEEASAIQTVWLRDLLLDEPYRGQLDALLRDYIRERRTLPQLSLDAHTLDAEDKRTEALQARIWQATAAALKGGDPRMTTTVLQATNDMFDLPAARRAALDAQVPGPVFMTLVLVGLIAAALTGYGLAASRRRHLVASSGLFMAAALISTLIIELDEPRTGLIRVSQAPFERTAATILAMPPVN